MGKIARVRTGIALLICLPLIVACATRWPLAPGMGAHRFGESFTTAAEKPEIVEEKIFVSYQEVSEDSRCPKNVACIWQGAAIVKMIAMVEGDQPNPFAFQLASAPEAARSALYKGYRIELIDVAPYPDGQQKPAPDEYRVTLRVTRAH